MEFDAMIIRIC